MNNQNMLENVYTVTASDGEHTVKISHLGRNDPLVIFVDGELVKKVQRTGGLFPGAEDTFPCGDKDVLLISFGNQEDLVVDGTFVKSKKKYEKVNPKSVFRTAIAVLSVLLTVMIPIVFHSAPILLALGALCVLDVGVLAFMFARSPLISNKKVIVMCLGLTLLCWLIILALHFCLPYFNSAE